MKQTIETVINLMAASAITAPKAGGKSIFYDRKTPTKKSLADMK